MELDAVNFTDDAFDSFISIRPSEASTGEDGGSPSKRKMKHADVMTDELYYRDVETNTKYKKESVSIQTDKMIGTNTTSQQDDEDDQYYDDDERPAKANQHGVPEYNAEALATWLSQLYPRLSQVLDANANSKIFDSYEVFWEEERGEVEMWQKLQTSFDFQEANRATQKAINQVKQSSNEAPTDFDDDWGGAQNDGKSGAKKEEGKSDATYQVVSVAWSCNGATLAVAYGKTNHTTWCEHHSAVSTWGIFRREFDPKKPNNTIEVSNCLTCIEFHPNDPLILAGGTLNGEVYLWNIDNEDPYICHSAIDEYYHREAITKLIWVRYESLTSLAVSYSLMTVSTDGKILVWRVNDKLRYPVKGHLLARKKGGELSIVGGTSFARVYGQDDNTFLVGTEGGSIFKCAITQPQDKDISHFFENTGVKWKQEAISLLGNLPNKAIMEVKKKVERYVMDKGEKDVWAPTVYHAKPDLKLVFSIPFNANYERHLGPVLGISSSPFIKRLFLSCSSDGSVRLYDILNHRPISIFEPGYNEYLLDVAWSPFRPAVFAAVSNTGNVYLYDLVFSKSLPSQVLKHQDDSVSTSQRVAQTVSFNPKQRDFLAVGYHDGYVRIYRLNYQLANQQKSDMKVMQSYLEEKGSE